MSGYVQCKCPNCFEIAIEGDDDEDGTFCSECEEASCDGESDCNCELE